MWANAGIVDLKFTGKLPGTIDFKGASHSLSNAADVRLTEMSRVPTGNPLASGTGEEVLIMGYMHLIRFETDLRTKPTKQTRPLQDSRISWLLTDQETSPVTGIRQ